jgi:ComF family protein
MEMGAGLVKTMSHAAGRLGAGLLDLAWPPTCLACGAPTARHAALCASCFVAQRPITRPLCPRLGIPFESDPGPGAISTAAMVEPPPFRRARAALVYNDIARKIVARMKYGDHPELARYCARLMHAAGAEFWPERPVLVPVPMHRTRLWRRHFNQSLEIARELSLLTGCPVEIGLVRRDRPTRAQVGLTGRGRRRNLQGAFIADKAMAQRLGNRPMLLIDDVVTTGATARAVTLALNRAGLHNIDVLSFARVVVGAETPI